MVENGMLTMDFEVDPLNLKDPLDSRPDAETEAEDPPKLNELCGSEVLPIIFPLEECAKTWKSPRIRKLQRVSGVENSDFENRLRTTMRSRKKRITKKESTGFKKNRKKHQKSIENDEGFECDPSKTTLKDLGFDGEILDDMAEEERGSASVKTAKVTRIKNNRNESRSKIRKHGCHICQKTFITIGHLKAHMLCHSEKKWKCDGCGKNFSCDRSLIRHRDTFPGEHWFPCQHCEMNFFRVENILKHLEIKHPEASLEAKTLGQLFLSSREDENKKLFICTKCLVIFYNSKDFESHKESEKAHQNSGITEDETTNEELTQDHVLKYQCEICSKGFVSLEGFEYHKNNQHVKKETKRLKKMKEVVLSNSDQEETIDKTENKALVCKICGETFPTRASLQVHGRSHGGKNGEIKAGNHQCCICPRSFASSDGLKYHLATHTGERRYSCTHCGKKFIKKTHLYEHLATHSKVKCFKCPRCPRTFCTHSAYRKHMKHFPGPHSFPCTKCGKLFTKESMLEKHVCVDLVKVTMAPEVKALLTEDGAIAQESGVAVPSSLPVSSTIEKESKLKGGCDEEFNGNSHSCYKCFKVFPSLAELQAHQYEHIGKQQYQCRFCPESFKRADDFGVHIRSHLGSSPYMCLKCNRKFISPLTLSMHAKKYPGEHSFNCSKCQRWFPSEKRLEKHECILQNSEAFICACGSPFQNWTEFQGHAGTKPYKCCSCGSKYLTLVALTRHIKKHTGVKPFSCETCGKSFRVKNNYLNHLNVHKESKEIQCEHCDFKSRSKKRMNFHLFRKHDVGSNSSSTLCPVCGIIFPYMTHVKKHIETEHANELSFEETRGEKKSLPMVLCTLCGKLLSNKYMLANHMKKIHDPDASKNNQEYECEVCKEKFRNKKRLERHGEVHEVPGLRTCEICSREFFSAKDFRKHMKRHDTNKPFSCPKCGKHFKVSVSLKYHSSICGGGTANSQQVDDITANALTNGTLFYGHVDTLDLKNVCYPMIST